MQNINIEILYIHWESIDINKYLDKSKRLMICFQT